ncbi:hypothetical protein ACR6C2_02805 [Streptomyces sp. INA 01156]
MSASSAVVVPGHGRELEELRRNVDGVVDVEFRTVPEAGDDGGAGRAG